MCQMTPQNAKNGISGTLDLKMFLGELPLTHLHVFCAFVAWFVSPSFLTLTLPLVNIIYVLVMQTLLVQYLLWCRRLIRDWKQYTRKRQSPFLENTNSLSEPNIAEYCIYIEITRKISINNELFTIYTFFLYMYW